MLDLRNFNFTQGATVDFQQLREINEALRANKKNRLDALQKAMRKGGIGYQTPATASAEEFSPLVPESIEEQYSIATFANEALTFTQDITEIDVTQNVHTWATLTGYNSHGPGAPMGMAEGGLPPESASVFVRGNIQLRYSGEYRTVTDVATTTGLLPTRRRGNAHAMQVDLGMQSLAGGFEWNNLHGDDDVTPYGYDGVLKQIRAVGNNTDLRGATLTLATLANHIARITSTDAFARPNVIYVDSASFAPLSQEAAGQARFAADKGTPSYHHGVDGKSFFFMGPFGAVNVRLCPFIDFSIWTQPTTARGTAPPSKPVVTSALPAADPSSLFVLADAGVYSYSLIAITRDGQMSVPTEVADIPGVAIAAGDIAEIVLNDAAAKAAADPVVGYILYRSEVDGLFSTIKEIARVPVNTLGGLGNTQINDINASVYNCGKVLITRQNPLELCVHRLLDTMHRPLAAISTAERFALLGFKVPTVKLPQRSWVIDNVGKPAFV